MGIKMQELAQRHILAVTGLILSKYKPLNIDCACILTTVLQCQTDPVFWNARWIPLDMINLDISPDADIRKIQIKFWGGPPGKEAYFTGSVWSFIADRVARHIITHGYEATRDKLRVS